MSRSRRHHVWELWRRLRGSNVLARGRGGAGLLPRASAHEIPWAKELHRMQLERLHPQNPLHVRARMVGAQCGLAGERWLPTGGGALRRPARLSARPHGVESRRWRRVHQRQRLRLRALQEHHAHGRACRQRPHVRACGRGRRALQGPHGARGGLLRMPRPRGAQPREAASRPFASRSQPRLPTRGDLRLHGPHRSQQPLLGAHVQRRRGRPKRRAGGRCSPMLGAGHFWRLQPGLQRLQPHGQGGTLGGALCRPLSRPLPHRHQHPLALL
mmetsp:Transcript_5551/g.16355  ORF Transcript_5551/g.16355 Transcript_5551/m.16355 type:complete len:271 (+) Transcript_5551:404-1216(+)